MCPEGPRKLGLLGKCRESLTFAEVVGQGTTQKVIHAFVGKAREKILGKGAELLICRQLGECTLNIVRCRPEKTLGSLADHLGKSFGRRHLSHLAQVRPAFAIWYPAVN